MMRLPGRCCPPHSPGDAGLRAVALETLWAGVLRTGWLAVVLVLAQASPVGAQQAPVATSPVVATSAGGNSSSTISVTNTFQQIWPANVAPQYRRGCTVQNNGANNMWVTEGIPFASATKAKATVINPGGVYNCQFGGMVLVGEIAITGTSGDAFYAAQE